MKMTKLDDIIWYNLVCNKIRDMRKKYVEELEHEESMQEFITTWNSKFRNISDYFFIDVDGKLLPEDFFEKIYNTIETMRPPLNNDLSLKKYLSLKYMRNIFIQGVIKSIYLAQKVAIFNPNEKINVYTSRDRLAYSVIYNEADDRFEYTDIDIDSYKGTELNHFTFIEVIRALLVRSDLPGPIQALEMDIDRYFYIKFLGNDGMNIESRSLINSSIVHNACVWKKVKFKVTLDKPHTIKEFNISKIFNGYKGLYHIIPNSILLEDKGVQNIKITNDVISITAHKVKGNDVAIIECSILLFDVGDKYAFYRDNYDNISISL